MAVAIAALALVAGAAGQAERAARMAGATQTLPDRAGCDLPAFLRGQYEQSLAALRGRLANGLFDRYFAAGHALAAADSLVEALGAGETVMAAEEARVGASSAYTPLSAREWKVARLVARGLKNREVAEHLVLAERTVSSHLECIFAELRITSRVRLGARVPSGP